MTSFRPTNDLQQRYTVQQRAYERNEDVMSYPDDFSKTSIIQSLYLTRSPYPNVFSIGCIFHLASLYVKDGVKALQFKVYDLLVDSFYFFHHSSKRIQEFKAFQEFTEVDEDRILKHCPARWLSLEKVVNRTLSHLPALKSYFESHKDVEKIGKVKSIHDRLHDSTTSVIFNFLPSFCYT